MSKAQAQRLMRFSKQSLPTPRSSIHHEESEAMSTPFHFLHAPLRALAALLLSLLVPSMAAAQVTLPEEYGRIVKSAEVVGSLGTDAFGDEVNLYTGSTQFTVTDIDLPVHSGLGYRARNWTCRTRLQRSKDEWNPGL